MGVESGPCVATAGLRIAESAGSGRSLCIGDEAGGEQQRDAGGGVLPAGTMLLSEAPLVSLATDGDCCDSCMTTGLAEQAAASRRRYRCHACGLNYCSERCQGQHTPAECAAFVAVDEAIGRQHPRNHWLRLVARTCLCAAARELLPSFCCHPEDRRKAAGDVALLSGLLSKCCASHASRGNNGFCHIDESRGNSCPQQVGLSLSHRCTVSLSLTLPFCCLFSPRVRAEKRWRGWIRPSGR